MVTVGRGGRRSDDAGDAAGTGATGVLRAVVVIVVVVVCSVQRAEGLLVRGLGILDQPGLRLVRLLLQQAVDLEPVGAPAVTRAGLGHAYQQAFPQAARLAGGAILLVDHADATVLAFGDAAEIVVGASEEGLCKQKAKEARTGQRLIVRERTSVRTRIRPRLRARLDLESKIHGAGANAPSFHAIKHNEATLNGGRVAIFNLTAN